MLVPANMHSYGRTHIAFALGTFRDDPSPLFVPWLQFENLRIRVC